MAAIFVAMTFVAAVVIDALIRRRQKGTASSEVRASISAKPAPSFPFGYFLTPGHIWLHLRSSGNFLMGLDELIQRALGTVEKIDLKSQSETIRKGDVLAVLTQGERDIHLLSPIDGTIEKTNSFIEKNPNTFSMSPYGKGWIYLVRPMNVSEALENFKVADRAKVWWSQEMKRLREFVQRRIPQEALVGSTLLDGGPPLDDIAEHFDQQTFEEFEALFLRPQAFEK